MAKNCKSKTGRDETWASGRSAFIKQSSTWSHVIKFGWHRTTTHSDIEQNVNLLDANEKLSLNASEMVLGDLRSTR